MNLIFKNPVTFKKITFDYKLLLFSYFPQEQKVQYIKKNWHLSILISLYYVTVFL